MLGARVGLTERVAVTGRDLNYVQTGQALRET